MLIEVLVLDKEAERVVVNYVWKLNNDNERWVYSEQSIEAVAAGQIVTTRRYIGGALMSEAR